MELIENKAFMAELEALFMKYSIVSTDDVTIKIPTKRWKDDKDALISGYIVYSQGVIDPIDYMPKDYLVYPTKALAKRAVAMKEIAQIMANDERFGGMVTDEERATVSYSWFINKFNEGLEPEISSTNCEYYFLMFHTEKQAQLFLSENYDLVCDFLMIPKKGE